MENQELLIQNNYLAQKLAIEMNEASKYAARCEILARRNAQLDEELSKYKEKERTDEAKDKISQSRSDESSNK